MREILLNNSYTAIVDDEDFERVSAFKWFARVRRRTVYATRNLTLHDGTKTMQYLHRFILGLTDPKIQADHINGDGLDNRRENLRPCTSAENGANRRTPRNNKCGIKGVTWHKGGGGWRAQIKRGGTVIHLGYFPTKESAGKAYAAAAQKHFGVFAKA